MCHAIIRQCSCGAQLANIHHRDATLPEEAVEAVYCPKCSVELDQTRMVADNGWIIEYDIEVARHFLQKRLPPTDVTPQRLFDDGWSSWNGLTPTDAWDKAFEMNELVTSTKGDPARYLVEFRRWTMGRTARLAQEGWRKASLAA
jgi:hypothetical protein